MTSSSDEFAEFLLFFMGFGKQTRSDVLSKLCDDLCVEPVGFGENAKTFGEVAHLTRIDDCDEMTVLNELGDESSLIPAGRFDDDQTRSRLGKLSGEFLQLLSVVVDRKLFFFGKNAKVERVFGDIDTDKRCDGNVHGNVPFLRIRARCNVRLRSAQAAVRTKIQRPTTIKLCDGLERPRHERSVVGCRGKVCVATLRRLSHDKRHYNICL